MSLIKRKTQNILACSLAALTAVTAAMPVYAAQNSAGSKTADVQHYNDLDKTTGSGVNGKDKDQGQQSTYKEREEGSYSSEVYASQNSKYTVTLPKVVVLNGEANTSKIYSGDYTIKVEGDIAGTKTINVDPFYSLTNTAADHFVMSQTNKDDVKATVNQTKTAFGANDLSNENQTATTTGTVSAKDLTAGSWNGKFYFNVNLNEPNAYYSTLALAVQDINDNTIDTDTSTADLQTAQDATCGVYKESNNTYRIEVYKDIDNQASITINKNVKMDLNDHTITFADGNYLTYTKDFSIYDGTLNSTNSNYVIFSDSENLESTFNTNDVIINQYADKNITTSVNAITVSNKHVSITKTTINQSGQGNSSYNIIGITSKNDNADSELNINNYIHTVNIVNAKNIIGIQKGTNLYCNNANVNINTNTANVYGVYSVHNDDNITNSSVTYSVLSSNCYGLFFGNNSNNAIVDNVTINGNSKGGTLYGIYERTGHKSLEVKKSNITIIGNESTSENASTDGVLAYGNNTTINNCNIFVATNNLNGCGIVGDNSSLFTVNKSKIFGKEWAIQIGENATANIRDCDISSTDHTAYILGNGDIYSTKFYIANRDKYTNNDTAWGLYCGGAATDKKAIVNFYNCTIGSKDDLSKNTFNGIVSQAHYSGKQYAPAEINLYDTDIYTTQRAFTFNIGSDDKPIATKFNIYGNGQIYVYNKSTNTFDNISKETLNNEISTWKTILRQKESSGYCVYNRGIIYGNEIANVDEGTNTIKSLKITDNANVYDYR